MIKICEECGKEYKTSHKIQKYCSCRCVSLVQQNRFKVICKYCGEVFEVKKSKKNPTYCSYKCMGLAKITKVEKICEYCGKKFKVHFSKSFHKYCSRKCGHMAKIQDKHNMVCEQCGKDFKVTLCHKNRKYCSKKCFLLAKKEVIYNMVCEQCGKSFEKPSSGRNQIYCSYKCMGLARRNKQLGENNPNYSGGKSNEPYPLEFNKTLKEYIRKRDNYKCQICGMPEDENISKLAIHHIDYDKNNINEDNLIATCRSCNSKANYNRDWKYYSTRSSIHKKTGLYKNETIIDGNFFMFSWGNDENYKYALVEKKLTEVERKEMLERRYPLLRR